jgi:hypothetical protein
MNHDSNSGYYNDLAFRGYPKVSRVLISTISGLVASIVGTLFVLTFFDVDTSYAYIKVFLALELFAILIYVISAGLRNILYRRYLRRALLEEMKFYLEKFDGRIDWGSSGWWGEFWYALAHNEQLSEKERTFAAIKYGVIEGQKELSPILDDWYYDCYAELCDEIFHGTKKGSGNDG